MLKITTTQKRILDNGQQATLESLAREHVRNFFAESCQKLGVQGLDEAIRFGLQWARFHGFDRRRDLFKYLNLMFVFGRNFDTDPHHAGWVAPLLHREGSPQLRMLRLYRAAIERAGDSLGYWAGAEDTENV